MSISNIERMVDALIRDELNMVYQMNQDELFVYVEELIREKFEAMPERHIIEEYERLA